MDLAVGQEGHPDNVGAALHGGVTATCWDGETRAVVAMPVPDGVEFAVLVPGFEASTAAARAALPASYPRPDAVYNVGRAALLVAAWTQGRFDLVGQAMGDRLHQPYRARAMFPWLDGVLAAARAAGALGAALSGAGPSVLGVAPAGRGAAVARAMEEALRPGGPPGPGAGPARRYPWGARRAPALVRRAGVGTFGVDGQEGGLLWSPKPQQASLSVPPPHRDRIPTRC